MVTTLLLIIKSFLGAAWKLLAGSGGSLQAVLYLFADNGKKSGREDGNVYMRNGRSRGFRVPALVRNTYTGRARVALGSFSSSWNSLVQSDRDSWLNFSYTSSDRFGRVITITGKQAYAGLNINLTNAGQANITTAPLVVAGVTGQFNVVLNAAAGANTMTWAYDITPVPAGNTVLVFATRPLRPGVKRPSQSAFRLIGTIAAATASPANVKALYVAKFGATAISANAGARILMQSIIVDNTTGEASAIAQADVLIAP